MSDREEPNTNQAKSGVGASGGITVGNEEETARKGDPLLIDRADVVDFQIAEQYLGITKRQRQNLVRRGILITVGRGRNRQITTESLKLYLPPRKPETSQG